MREIVLEGHLDPGLRGAGRVVDNGLKRHAQAVARHRRKHVAVGQRIVDSALFARRGDIAETVRVLERILELGHEQVLTLLVEEADADHRSRCEIPRDRCVEALDGFGREIGIADRHGVVGTGREIHRKRQVVEIGAVDVFGVARPQHDVGSELGTQVHARQPFGIIAPRGDRRDHPVRHIVAQRFDSAGHPAQAGIAPQYPGLEIQLSIDRMRGLFDIEVASRIRRRIVEHDRIGCREQRRLQRIERAIRIGKCLVGIDQQEITERQFTAIELAEIVRSGDEQLGERQTARARIDRSGTECGPHEVEFGRAAIEAVAGIEGGEETGQSVEVERPVQTESVLLVLGPVVTHRNRVEHHIGGIEQLVDRRREGGIEVDPEGQSAAGQIVAEGHRVVVAGAISRHVGIDEVQRGTEIGIARIRTRGRCFDPSREASCLEFGTEAEDLAVGKPCAGIAREPQIGIVIVLRQIGLDRPAERGIDAAQSNAVERTEVDRFEGIGHVVAN